ncbi:MAG: hypothetical protein EXR61_04740 [Chloroflexi bacterium]|nr:hypothetical protein [Chloroflexota bacterium]
MIGKTLLRLVRHNTWANLQLLAFCARLPQEQLAWTTPGVYGTFQATPQHTISVEHGYLLALTGEMPPGGMLTPDTGVRLSDLATRAGSNGERLEQALGIAFEPQRVITRRNGGKATAAIIVAQYIHHGSDHRTHVGTILGAHGVEPPLDAQGSGFDLWGYGNTVGEVTRP